MQVTPYELGIKLGTALAKAIVGAVSDADTQRHILAVTHQKAESTIRFHVALAAKRKKRGKK